jgi:hypothetical protein
MVKNESYRFILFSVRFTESGAVRSWRFEFQKRPVRSSPPRVIYLVLVRVGVYNSECRIRSVFQTIFFKPERIDGVEGVGGCRGTQLNTCSSSGRGTLISLRVSVSTSVGCNLNVVFVFRFGSDVNVVFIWRDEIIV